MTEYDLYEHRDEDGDQFKLVQYESGMLLAEIRDYSEKDAYRVRLTPLRTHSNLAVEQLYAALGRFLGKDQDGPPVEAPPAPALNVDTSVTADDVRRIAADEVAKALPLDFNTQVRQLAADEAMKLLINGAVNARHRDQMRAISRVQITGDIGREAILKVIRDTLTRAVELGVDR